MDFGDVVRHMWPPEFAHDVVALFRRTLETGEPYVAPELIRPRIDRGGETEYYEWQINRMPLPDGQTGVVCYFRDISARVLARKRLEAADRQKNEFLAMLAHELAIRWRRSATPASSSRARCRRIRARQAHHGHAQAASERARAPGR